MKKKVAIITTAAALVLIIAGIFGYFYYLKPHDEAVKKYESTVSVIKNKNKELEKEISKLQKLLDSGEKPLDKTLVDSSKQAIKAAKAEKLVIPEMPFKTSEIIKETEKYEKGVDYSKHITEIEEIFALFKTSQKQYKQFVKPSEEFILQRISEIGEISAAKPVTEDNDPNGQLNKKGGYIATVFFEDIYVDKEENFLEDDVIENGTDGGGAIEVYSNEKDAKSREEYLACFDGSAYSSGSHKVIGTTVIRTSNLLTASMQNELESRIIEVLSRLD